MFRRTESHAVAEPADRDEQDDAGDGDEYVVEAGQEAETFFINHGAGAQLSDMIAQGLCGLR